MERAFSERGPARERVSMARPRTKYGNRKTVVEGITFASQREARHYQELRLREKAGEIRGLVCQSRWRLNVNGVKVADYVADFEFDEIGGVVQGRRFWNASWTRVIADAKGFRTPVYKLKAKLMKAIHGIEIREL
jgi:hypothetical protein